MRLWETPVPIPNTTVKTQAADGTALETMWESRRAPDYGDVAQLGEHLPCKQGVRSSILLISTSVCETNASIHVMLTTSRRLFRQGVAFYASKKCSC